MGKHIRGERLSAEYQRVVSEIIATKLKDRVGGLSGLVSITKADVSPDLKNAKLYVSVLAKDDQTAKATFSVIVEHAGFIRHELAQTMRSRTVPELHFLWDDTMEYGAKIDRLIHKLPEGVAT